MGGAQRAVANMANYWSNIYEVVIVTTDSKETDFYYLKPEIKRVSLCLSIISSNKVFGVFNNLKRLWMLRKVVRKEDPNVAISMLGRNNALLALASIGLSRITFIGSERTYAEVSFATDSFVWNRFKSWAYRNINTLVVQTEDSKEWLLNKNIKANVVVIPNMVTWPITSVKPIIEPKLNDEKPNTILAVGRLTHEKSFHTLIKSFSKVVIKYPNWQLIIIGEGPEREKLENEVKKNGVQENVSLIGAAGNVGDWYEFADIFVMSSVIEGFPNALVEAMSYGLPVISTDCKTGPSDVIEHDVNGLLVPPEDVCKLQAAIEKLIVDNDLRKKFSEESLSVREKFSEIKIMNQWEELFPKQGM